MKKKFFLVLVIFISIFLGSRLFIKDEILEEDYDFEVKHNNYLSMMIEQTAGTGDYELETRPSWPTKDDGYVFNKTLSKCQNGSKLKWDDENNMVLFSGSVGDKCYVYFDVYMPSTKVGDVCNNGDNLSGCVQKLYEENESELTNIYYHDSNLTRSAGDLSYRYAGADPSNYVCFGTDDETCSDDNLYRIIGVFGTQVKLIKTDYANSNLLGENGDFYTSGGYASSSYSSYKGSLTTINRYYWNYSGSKDKNTWGQSKLNTINLNTAFVSNIGSEWAKKIAKTTWKVGGNTYQKIQSTTIKTVYANEITNPAESTTYDAKIGLMYVSDFGYASTPSTWTTNLSSYSNNDVKEVNWMYMGLYEWTITRETSALTYAFYINSYGAVNYDRNYVGSIAFAVRPVFYLNSDVKYVSGDGTKISPIRLS